MANEVGVSVCEFNGVITGAVLVVCVGTEIAVVVGVVVVCALSFENHAFITLVNFSSVFETLGESDGVLLVAGVGGPAVVVSILS